MKFSINTVRRPHTARTLVSAAFVALSATLGFGSLFSLAGCQTGLDGAGTANAPADVVAGKNGGQVAGADDSHKELTPEERKRKIAEFLAKPEVKQTSQGLEELAKLVAVAVEDEALRNQIYARCMEKFDGETNVLWKQLDGDAKLRSNGAGFSARIDGLAAKARGANAGAGVVSRLGGVNAALAQFEKAFNAPVHLFWMYPSQWDKRTTPLVAFVPQDIDPDTRKSIPVFDAKGNRFTLESDGALAQKRPVIVVTFNERAITDGSVKSSLGGGVSHENVKNVDGHQSYNVDLQKTASKKSPIESGKEKTQVQPIWDLYSNSVISLVNVHIEYYGDELPWDGAAEFEYAYWQEEAANPYGQAVQQYREEPRRALGWNQRVFTGLQGHTWGLKMYRYDSYWGTIGFVALKCGFRYYEDDGASLWDDWMGEHQWSRTLDVPAIPFVSTPGVINAGGNGFVQSARYDYY